LSFYFRVFDPKGIYTTEPVQVFMGEQLNLVLEPVPAGGLGGPVTPSVGEPTTSQ
jgi:hypothetical protein